MVPPSQTHHFVKEMARDYSPPSGMPANSLITAS